MRIKLVNLKGYSEEETHLIRRALDVNNIQYFETSRNMLDMSQATIWLKDGDQERLARDILKSIMIECNQNQSKLTFRDNVTGIVEKYRNNKRDFISLIVLLIIVIYLFATGTRHAM